MPERIRDLFSEMERMQEEMDRLFREMRGGGARPLRFALPEMAGAGELTPAIPALRDFRAPLIDVSENEKTITLTAEVPGVDKKDIDIKISEDSVEIKVEKKAEVKEEKKGYYRMERSYRGFYRMVPLPSKILPETAEAKYNSGVLEITLPKAKLEKPAKKLEVK